MKISTLLIALGVTGMATMNVMAGGLLSPKAADNKPTAVRAYNSDPSLTATGLKAAPPHVVESRAKTAPGKSTEVTPWMINSRRMSGSPKMVGECANRSDGTMSCCAPAPAPIK